MTKPLKKILYAEDEIDIQKVAGIALTQLGNYELKTVSSGKEILEVIDKFMPDMILSDIMMGDMDGATMLKELRKNPKYNDIPVIFITAKAQKNEIEEYKEIGALEVITKPFNPITISQDIRRIWGDYLSQKC